MTPADDQPQDGNPKLDDLSGIPGLDFQSPASDSAPSQEFGDPLAGISGLDRPSENASVAENVSDAPSSFAMDSAIAPGMAPDSSEAVPDLQQQQQDALSTEGAAGEPQNASAETPAEAEPSIHIVENQVDPAAVAAASASSPDPMQKLKALSENVQIATAPVEAAYPFSLRIEGRLNAWERAKLIDLLNSENMGIREVDLEPQFEAGRILIPRISEYAGVLLVQALRGTSAEMTLGPSDQIYSTPDTREDLSIPPASESARQVYITPGVESDDSHPAEKIPIVTDPEVPGRPVFEVIDLVTASAALSFQAVEAEKSTQYQDLLEALQRELRYKAHRKGAQAIVSFSAKLETLRLASQYRLIVMGSAIRY